MKLELISIMIEYHQKETKIYNLFNNFFDSVYRSNKSYYLQVLLEEFIYTVKDKTIKDI